MTVPHRLRRSRRAGEDLMGIWRRVAADDAQAADRVLDRIDRACSRLAHQPFLGASRDDIRPGLRYVTVGSYVVLHSVDDDGVLIVRVVHGRTDP